MSAILRGGRLSSSRKDVVNFMSSVEEDKRIATATIWVNQAHVKALAKAKAISRADAKRLLRALRGAEKRIQFRNGVEDVHVLIEEYVTKRAGAEVGGQLHLGKSRNDQVVTALRITLRQDLLSVSNELIALERELLALARKHLESLFPGYTHLQPAQPITFAHYLLAIGDSLLRDNERITDAYKRVNMSPMGAAALAGSSVNLDRAYVARLLGFEGVVENSLDAVGTRDFVLEVLAVCAITALDITRVAQDLIFYSSSDVGLIDIPDEFTSTSSIMPQKKNPDPLEIIRARSAEVVGNFGIAATTIHALPSGYNLDFQEVTRPMWRSIDILKSCLRILKELVPKLKLKKTIASRRYLELTGATEVANTLVRVGKLPFRTAHRIVGEAVRVTINQGITLKELTPAHWKDILGRPLDERTLGAVAEALDLDKQVRGYRTLGSPNPKHTVRMIGTRERRTQDLLRHNTEAAAKLRTRTTELRRLSSDI